MNSHENIKTFQQKIKHENVTTGQTYQLYHPIEKVGVYVPVEKQVTLLCIDGCNISKKLQMLRNYSRNTTSKDGINSAILAACYIAGVNRVFSWWCTKYSCFSLRNWNNSKVDKIVGPGNQFVSFKQTIIIWRRWYWSNRRSYEIAIIADDYSNVDYIIQDILAQDEHDEKARTFLISTDKSFLTKVSQIYKSDWCFSKKRDYRKSISDYHYLFIQLTQTKLLISITI